MSDDTAPRSEAHPPISLPAIGFGCSALGNLYQPISERESMELLDAAWEAGIRYFDTAPHYGPAVAEERLGRWLENVPRDEVLISSKVGRLVVPTETPGSETDAIFAVDTGFARLRDYRAAGIRRSVEESLTRLRVDHLDLALVHDPDDYLDQARTESIPTLAGLENEGLVRALGVGMSDTDALTRFVEETHLDAIICASRYTLLDQRAIPLLELAPTHGTKVILAAVFNGGILAKADGRFNYRTVPEDVAARVRLLREACDRYGVPLAAAALQFATRSSAETTMLGPSNTVELHELLAWIDLDIPEELWKELAAID